MENVFPKYALIFQILQKFGNFHLFFDEGGGEGREREGWVSSIFLHISCVVAMGSCIGFSNN